MNSSRLLMLSLALALVAPLPAVARAPQPPLSPLDGSSAAGEWSSIGQPPHPDGREQPVLVHAPELNAIVVLGGMTRRGVDDDLWVLDLTAGEWRRVIPQGAGPDPRANRAGVWDPVGRRLVLFGGVSYDVAVPAAYNNDVWAVAFDPSGASATWQRLAPDPTAPLSVVGPSPRAWHTASYDPVGRRMLVYGGFDLLNTYEGFGRPVDDLQRPFTQRWLLRYALGDAWAFDLQTRAWSLLSNDGMRRYGHQAVYDPVNRQLVVTGGYGPPEASGSWYRPETESLDPATGAWTRWDPAGQAPAFRDPAFDYSPSLGAMLVMGLDQVWDSDLSPRDVYALTLGPSGSGAEWRRLPANRPQRALLGMRGVVVGGPERFVVMGGYLGGSISNPDRDWKLWSYDTATDRWGRELPGVEPLPTGVFLSAAAAPIENALYSLASFEHGPPQRLDLATGRWTLTGPPGGAPPSGRIAHDPASGRLFVVEACMNRVWVKDPGAGWRSIEPPGDVMPACGPQVVFDPPRRRLLMVGGNYHSPTGGASIQNRLVFALEQPPGGPARWEQLSPAGSGQFTATPVYDPHGDRLIAHKVSGTIQALDFSDSRDGRWEEIPVEGQGTPQAFDVANNRALWYRCSDGTVHALELEGDRTWRQVEAAEGPQQCLSAIAYDPVGRRLVVHGGNTGETFALGLGGSQAPPARPDDPAGPATAPPAVDAGAWRPLGPGHAAAHDVDFSTAGDGRAFVATTTVTYSLARGSGVWVSEDAGGSWSPASGDTAGEPMTEIAQSPADPARAYAASIGRMAYGNNQGTGMYVSEDGGQTWRRSDRGLAWDSYWALAAHPSDPLVAWAAGERGGVYRTDDGGETWHEVAQGQMDGFWVNALAALPTPVGVRVVAGVRQDDSGPLSGDGGVFFSDDGGESWDLGFETEQFVKALAVDPSDPSRVVAAEGDGAWRSDDFGTTWEHVNGDTWRNRTGTEVHLGAIAFDPTSEGQVLWGGGLVYPCNFKDGIGGGAAAPPQTPGIWRSTDGGRTWKKVQGPPGNDEYCGLAVSADGRMLLASGYSSGLWRSTDGGSSWQRADDRIAHDRAVEAAAHAEDPDTIVAAMPGAGALVSRDGGATWTPGVAGTGHHAVAVPGVPGRFLATVGDAVHTSDDWGDTWSATSVTAFGSGYAGGLTVDPTDPDTWYVPSIVPPQTPGQIASIGIGVTRDNGNTWRFAEVRSEPGPSGLASCPWSIAVDPFDPVRVYVGDVCGNGVFHSGDRGETWSRIAPSVGDGYVTALTADPGRQGRVWAGTQHFGVYRSDDGGETWAPARRGIGFREVRGLAVTGERVFAATMDHGVYASDDDGAHWGPAMDGSPVRAVLGLSVVGGGRILAGSHVGGVLLLEAEG